jgi:hypothetical protein
MPAERKNNPHVLPFGILTFHRSQTKTDFEGKQEARKAASKAGRIIRGRKRGRQKAYPRLLSPLTPIPFG